MTVGTRLDKGSAGREQAVAALAQFGLLVALWASVGLREAGWIAGTAYGAAVWAVLAGALRRSGVTALGPADRVTLGRAVLVGGVTALAVVGAAHGPVFTLVASVALVLDAVDGKVARRTGTCSRLGARFDMEVDAFLIMVLSVQLAMVQGPWVLAIGAMRYAFVAASWVLPWLNAPLPPSFARKTVAACQGIALVAACSGILPGAAAAGVAALALGALVWSFGRDIAWLWRTRPVAAPGGGHEALPAPVAPVASGAGQSSWRG
ncbi:CDP-alcohol phosphatidyltransferase family protein [Streptomyces sp. NPDC088732]|uniref:CDP-alcohol phosphatidyltransferase family protein n=1 Tax=Streptomyces sp. NPDC088732 TaxID=3365879 RepID=UPI0037F63BFB